MAARGQRVRLRRAITERFGLGESAAEKAIGVAGTRSRSPPSRRRHSHGLVIHQTAKPNAPAARWGRPGLDSDPDPGLGPKRSESAADSAAIAEPEWLFAKRHFQSWLGRCPRSRLPAME